jgi:hypothetical protein
MGYKTNRRFFAHRANAISRLVMFQFFADHGLSKVSIVFGEDAEFRKGYTMVASLRNNWSLRKHPLYTFHLISSCSIVY